MRHFVTWAAPRLGRAVLIVAATTFLIALALTALGVTVTTWPYRQIAGPSRRRTQVETLLALATALTNTAAAFRHETGERR